MNKKENFNPSYIGRRPDIEKLLIPNTKNILDVGCSNGAAGEFIKSLTGAHITGIELSPEMAKTAKTKIDRIYIGDAASVLQSGKLDDLKFDTIIFADILEHLADPWGVLEMASRLLVPGGAVIASIPNIRHFTTINNLIFRGYWPYRERGIHDKTHLRFFTRKNIMELFTGSGLKIDKIHTNYRIFEEPYRLNGAAKFLALPLVKNFLAYQYVVRGRLSK